MRKNIVKNTKTWRTIFKDNFSLNVKATNVVGSGDGVEVYVHCDDHDIVFNASIPLIRKQYMKKAPCEAMITEIP